jgi:hypothetical protein
MVLFSLSHSEYSYEQNSILDSQHGDGVFASFSIINAILIFVWSIILYVHRKTVTLTQTEIETNNRLDLEFDHATVYNPSQQIKHFEPVGDQVTM